MLENGWTHLVNEIYWRVQDGVVELIAFDGRRVYNEIYIPKDKLMSLINSELFRRA